MEMGRTETVMSPPSTAIVPKARTPRKEDRKDSPMRRVERPISPMRERIAPEYTPTPKVDQNKDYEECKKKVEEEMSGATKKYVIPKKRDPRNRSESPEESTYKRGNTLGMLD